MDETLEAKEEFVTFKTGSGEKRGEILNRLPDYYGKGKDGYHIATYHTVPIDWVVRDK